MGGSACPECGATRYRINGSIGMGEPRYRQRCTRGCPSDFAPLGPPVCASCMNLAIAATAEGPYCQDHLPPNGAPITTHYNQIPPDVRGCAVGMPEELFQDPATEGE